MDSIDSLWIQGGALAILGAVLGAIGLWLKGYLKGQQERGTAQDERMWQLIAADIEERKASTTRLDTLVQTSVEAQQHVAVSLNNMEKENDNHETACQARHDKLANAVSKETIAESITEALKEVRNV